MKNLAQLCKLIASILLLFIHTCVGAQTMEHYFSDNTGKSQGQVLCGLVHQNTIIYGGSRIIGNHSQPIIVRMDTLGEVLWNTANLDTQFTYGHHYVSKIIYGEDNYLYALTYFQNNSLEVWKLDPFDGRILYKKSIATANNFTETQYLIEFDSDHLLLTYLVATSVLQWQLKVLDKETGETVNTYPIGSGTGKLHGHLTLDNQKNIYITSADSVFKLSGLDPSNILWSEKFVNSSIDEYYRLHYDSSGDFLYLVGIDQSHGKIVKVRASDGAHLSTIGSNIYINRITETQVAGGNIYIGWQSSLTGGNPYSTASYNILGDSMNWSNSYTFLGGGSQGVLALAVDDSLNLYSTGYFRSPYYGCWGMLKQKASDGSPVYNKYITKNPSSWDSRSSGKLIFLINGKLYVIGELQTASIAPFVGYYEHALVKMDPVSGDILMEKVIPCRYQLPSKTLSIMRYGSSSTVVFKQVGRQLALEMYDSAKSLIWVVPVSSRDFLFGGALGISPDGNIYIAACTRGESTYYPYYTSSSDTLIVYRFNAYGNIMKSYRIPVGSSNVMPIELHCEDSNVLLVYHKSGLLHTTVLTLNNISGTIYTGINYTEGASRYAFNKDSSTAYLFGNVMGSPKIVAINKINITTAYTANLPSVLHKTNYILPLDSSKVIFCGRDNQNRPVIALINPNTNDTVWTMTMSTSGTGVLKAVAGIFGSNVYSIVHSNHKILIRKQRVSDGYLIWEKAADSLGTAQEYPMDLAFDSLRNELLITGYADIDGARKVLIFVMDSSGTKRQHLLKHNPAYGFNTGHCATVLADGTRWFGGSFATLALGRSGYIFEMDACNSYSYIAATECDQYTGPSGKYTWMETGIYTDTLSNVLVCDSIISIQLNVLANGSTIQAASCKSYTSPSGKYIWYSSGTYRDTLLNSAGCDSLITILLTIGQDTSVSINANACSQYTGPSGRHTWTSSGIYTDTLRTALGCDSLITIHLTLYSTTASVINVTTCNSFISPSKRSTWSLSGVYYDTLLNSAGCDSVITVNLTVHRSSFRNLNITACKSYKSPGGAYIWTTSGQYFDTLVNRDGCDSIISINLTIVQSLSSSFWASACVQYTSPSGKYIWTSSGMYYDTLPGSQSCDSVVSVNLTIVQSLNSSFSATACGQYTSPSGKYLWTSSGIYYDTLPSSQSCDSIINLNLTITTVDVGVTILQQQLIANQALADYQWLNCNGLTQIPGATGQQFIPSVSGDYAVAVTTKNCTDTSACYSITITGWEAEENIPLLKLFPNPSEGHISLTYSAEIENKIIRVYTVEGRIISEFQAPMGGKMALDMSSLAKGYYIIEACSEKGVIRTNFIIR